MVKQQKIITICSGAAFYKQLFQIGKELKKLGFKVKIPKIAGIMKKNNDFDVSHYKTWFKNKNDYKLKTELMTIHFQKVIESDAILVLNFEKNGIPGYIGGNVLMEMVIAFHYKKPIFIYNPISEELSTKEEIYGLNPVFIENNLDKIKNYGKNNHKR